MKTAFALIATAMAFARTVPIEPAAAQGSGYRYKKERKVYRSYHSPRAYYRSGRPQSVGPNGLCQRDTGTPTGQLNFRNRCDVEEFWNRMNERGSGRR